MGGKMPKRNTQKHNLKNKMLVHKFAVSEMKRMKTLKVAWAAALDKKVARAWMAVSRFPPNWGPPPKPW